MTTIKKAVDYPRKIRVPSQFLQRSPSLPKLIQWFLVKLASQCPDYFGKDSESAWNDVLQFKEKHPEMHQRDFLVRLASNKTVIDGVRARALFILLCPQYLLHYTPFVEKMGEWKSGIVDVSHDYKFLKNLDPQLRCIVFFSIEQFTIACEHLFLNPLLFAEDMVLCQCAQRIEMLIALYEGICSKEEMSRLYHAYPVWIFEGKIYFSDRLKYDPRLQLIVIKKSQKIIRDSIAQKDNDIVVKLVKQYFCTFIGSTVHPTKKNTLSQPQRKNFTRHLDFVFDLPHLIVSVLFSDCYATAQWMEKVWCEILIESDVSTREILTKALMAHVDELDVISKSFLEKLQQQYASCEWWSVSWYALQIARLAESKSHQELITKQSEDLAKRRYNEGIRYAEDIGYLLENLKK